MATTRESTVLQAKINDRRSLSVVADKIELISSKLSDALKEQVKALSSITSQIPSNRWTTLDDAEAQALKDIKFGEITFNAKVDIKISELSTLIKTFIDAAAPKAGDVPYIVKTVVADSG